MLHRHLDNVMPTTSTQIWEMSIIPEMRILKHQTQAQLSAFSSMDDEINGPKYDEVSLHIGPTDVAFEYLRKLDLTFTDDDTRFMGHDLHPYPAKFIPQLPGTFTSLLSSRGELVFDPFGGSGTTALDGPWPCWTASPPRPARCRW